MKAQEQRDFRTLEGITIELTPGVRELLRGGIAGDERAVTAMGAMVGRSVVELADTEGWVREDGA